ncbi:dTDP-4-dehydrorhamnose reductase [Geminocystis sp. NIES-3709]|uniref:dTDP-4-dehydrorhamnose reductase n=1 Tax=Geminocystis sp. NIES-3709 TaxID=1617448 RepID=UPI0005FC6156|nr:dTDP-4-dehydrorhamnose reductase [Geminocystis sp. NIES-3709]BAQ64891.1 dTDP-4-dehydrorhamnose reductase [Geminocystis sp. NIES-3709]
MTKILLFGSQGQVGKELTYTLPIMGELIKLDRTIVDLTEEDKIRTIIQEIKPNIIVNSAAYTAVDKAEFEPDLAYHINSIVPKIIAEEGDKIKAKLIHISTDYVFDGKANTPYLEIDLTNPLGVYGKSKLLGEENIQQNIDNYIILRTAWVYGIYGKSNFLKTMIRLGKQREEIKVVIDQIGCPTYAEDIALVINKIINQFLQEKNIKKIYHFTNLGVCSWYDFAVNIFKSAEKLSYDLKVKEILPIFTSEYPTPAKRPAYSVLSTKKITQELDITPSYWQDSLNRYFIKFNKYRNII